jgi:hypothetical protein
MHHHHHHTQLSIIFNPFGWYFGNRYVNTPFSSFMISLFILAIIIYLIVAAVRRNRRHSKSSQSPNNKIE